MKNEYTKRGDKVCVKKISSHKLCPTTTNNNNNNNNYYYNLQFFQI